MKKLKITGPNYYAILGVEKTATTAEIKSAYKNFAKIYHPDLNPGNLEIEIKFKEIIEAYTILTHVGKRKDFDTFGKIDDKPNYQCRTDYINNMFK